MQPQWHRPIAESNPARAADSRTDAHAPDFRNREQLTTVDRFPASRNTSLRVKLGCDLAAVRPMTAMIRTFLEEQNATAEETQSAELAIVEGANNAIKYA